MASTAPSSPKKSISFAEDYEIRPPTTAKDEGKPSDSILKDTRRILALIQDERHFAAYSLYQSVKQRLADFSQGTPRRPPKNGVSPFRRRKKNDELAVKEHELKAAEDLLASKRAEMRNLERKCHVLQKAQTTLNVDEDWILSQTLFGVTTHYRREADNSLSIKMEGDLKGVPLFEQVAVLKEVDLHYKWAPFCSSSLTVKDLDKLDTVGWFLIGLPQFGLARDGAFRAFGCDNMMEDGTILLVGQGLEDRSEDEPYAYPYLAEVPDDLDIPKPPSRLGSGRMTIREFSAVVRVLSPTSVETKMVANINPNLTLVPQSLIDFVMRKLCGVVFSKLQQAAKKAHGNPVKNAHAKRMRREEKFYKGWLMAKFQAFCDREGWTMPPVPAFQLNDAELEREYVEDKLHRSPRGSRSFYDEQKSDETLPEGAMQPSSSSPNFNRDYGDDVSAVTSASSVSSKSSVFSNNPIAQYLRDMEARTKATKATKVAAARKRADDRLKPKELPENLRSRLEELKLAKARRRGFVSSESSQMSMNSLSVEVQSVPVPDKRLVGNNGFVYRLHDHGRVARFVFSSILISTLFAVLNADALLGFDQTLNDSDPRLWMSLLLDMGTLAYLLLCAFVHFVFCFVSLVYAFDALEVGMKTGSKSKQFYSSTVGLGTAIASGAMVLSSVIRAIMTVWFRAALWYCSLAKDHCVSFLVGMAQRVDPIGSLKNSTIIESISSSILLKPIISVVGFTLNAVSRTCYIAYTVLVSVISRSFGVVGPLFSFFRGKLDRAFAMYDGGAAELWAWRGQAIGSSQWLLSYTSVFLLSCLVLFNLSAKSRSRSDGQPNDDATAPVPSEVDAFRPSAPGQYRRSVSKRVSSLSVTPEEGEGFVEEDMSTSAAQSRTEESLSKGSKAAKKHHRRLRFRREKKPSRSSPTIHEDPPAPMKFEKSKTF